MYDSIIHHSSSHVFNVMLELGGVAALDVAAVVRHPSGSSRWYCLKLGLLR